MTSRERLQATLNHKPVDRVCVDIFFEDRTGFVFNAIHNVQSNVPVENLLAMFRALDDVRG